MFFTRVFLIFALAALASAQAATTSLSPQESKAVNELVSYQNSLTSNPAFTAAVAAFSSAVPSSVVSEIINNPNYLQSAFSSTALPTWYTATPTSAQAVLSSFVAAENSIASKDVAGLAPTNAVKVGIAALAAGGAVLTLL